MRRTNQRWASGTWLSLAAAALALLIGCQGSGRVEVVALDYKAIDPPAPHCTGLNVDRCYWWSDEAGHVWVAMERNQPWLFGRTHFVFQLSLMLEKLPAGKARNYLIGKQELRAAARFGPAQSRFVSLNGIVALYRESGERLRGSYRLQVARKTQGPLGNWSSGSRHLMMGTFTAVHDEEAGRRIAADTEADGWERQTPESQPAPTSQPTEPGVR